MKNIVFLNNVFVSEKKAKININDRGFLLGDGLFETIRAYKGHVLFLDKHYNRLINSAELLHIPFRIKLNNLKKIISELLTINHRNHQESIIRITLTRGAGGRGLKFIKNIKPTILITAVPWTPVFKQKLKTFISSIKRNEHSLLASLKSLNYLENIMARHEAESKGYDEALFLNSKGYVTEAASANLFFVNKKNQLLIPPIKAGILPGITREIIIQLAKNNRISVKEKAIKLNQLNDIKEMFLANSIIGLVPIISVNQQIIGSGKAGCIFKTLSFMFNVYIDYLIDHLDFI